MRFQQSFSAVWGMLFKLAAALAPARAQLPVRPLEQAFRAARVAFLLQRDRQVHQRLGMPRVEVQRLAIVFGRLAHPPGGIVQQPEEMKGLRRHRLAAQVLFAARQRLGQFALVRQIARPLDPGFGPGAGLLHRCRFGRGSATGAGLDGIAADGIAAGLDGIAMTGFAAPTARAAFARAGTAAPNCPLGGTRNASGIPAEANP